MIYILFINVKYFIDIIIYGRTDSNENNTRIKHISPKQEVGQDAKGCDLLMGGYLTNEIASLSADIF